MSKEDWAELDIKSLETKFKAARTLQRTVIGLFAVIVLAWVILGFWRSNPPVFISTIAMGLAATGSVSIAPSRLKAAIRKREEDA